MARQLLRGHQYLRMKGLQFDLVILNDHPTAYAENLQDSLQMAVRASGAQMLLDKPGGVFIRRSDLLTRRGADSAALCSSHRDRQRAGIARGSADAPAD